MHDKIIQLMLSRFHIDNQDGVIVERNDCEQVADEIISAFADEGYRDMRSNNQAVVFGGYLSGQEWYDRFDKERKKLVSRGDGETWMGWGCSEVLVAAKRAAGLE